MYSSGLISGLSLNFIISLSMRKLRQIFARFFSQLRSFQDYRRREEGNEPTRYRP